MRDRHFMDDENELPYMLWEKRDDNEGYGNGRTYPIKQDFEDIPFREFPSYVKCLILPSNHINNIINLVEVKPRNCIVSINRKDDEINFTFKIKNEYLMTKLFVRYNVSSGEMEYNGGITNHDDLESMQWFVSAVRRIEKKKGYRYEFCYNGQDFHCREGKLVINDDYQTMVMFEKDSDDSHYGYEVDFTARKLEFYHEYPSFEYFAFFG